MPGTRSPHSATLCAAILVIAAFLSAHAVARQGATPSVPPTIGSLSITDDQSPVLGRFLSVLARVRTAVAPHIELTGAAPFSEASGLATGDEQIAHWTLDAADGGGLVFSTADDNARRVEGFLIDLELDLATLRSNAPQPFSRSAAGGVLDALGVANARRVRYASLVDPDDDQAMLVIAATESRAQVPGKWRARRLFGVQFAETRATIEGPHPITLHFGESWEAVVRSLAGVVLAHGDNDEARTSAERISQWGAPRAAGLRAVTTGLQPFAHVWEGGGADSLVLALRLQPSSSDRVIATHLRAMFGQRLRWQRDADNRSTATLDLEWSAGAATDASQRLYIRFIRIERKSYLIAATRVEDLGAAPGVLAKLQY